MRATIGAFAETVSSDGERNHFSDRLAAAEQLLGDHVVAARHLAGQLSDLHAETRRLTKQLKSFAELNEADRRSQAGSAAAEAQAGGVDEPREGSADIPERFRGAQTISRRSSRKSFSSGLAAATDMVTGSSARNSLYSRGHSIMPGRIFADADELKDRIREKFTQEHVHAKRPMSLAYHKTGLFQSIARSFLFESCSLCMVCLNAVWIAVDIDFNNELLLNNSAVFFQVMAHVFCAFFAVEILIRFMAVQKKSSVLKEFWFMFDFILVILIVFETWVMSAIVAWTSSSLETGNLRMFVVFRILRLVRVLRLARVLREIPELLVMIRGIIIALRAMVVVLTLLGFIIYMAAIIFKVALEDTNLGRHRFSTVQASMGTLLIEVCLSGGRGGNILREAFHEHFLYSVLVLVFVVLANITVMGVLGGLLVQTVKTVAEIEKEEHRMKNTMLHMDQLWDLMQETDNRIEPGLILQSQLRGLLDDAAVCHLLRAIDVDQEGLVDMSGFIFDHHDGRLTKPEFKRMLLDLRGKNEAKVQDHVETRKFVHAELRRWGSVWRVGPTTRLRPPTAEQNHFKECPQSSL